MDPSTPASDRRVLDPAPVNGLAEHERAGGGRGLDAARRLGRDATIDEIAASGLRGRGGAGFPTGVKWRTVAGYARGADPAPTVVVNAAEGEPGSYKDRTLLRTNPYRVLEGALVAATAIGAGRVVVGTKRSFVAERARLEGARDEMAAAGWCDGIDIQVVAGPEEYLLGEETALLEVLDGRPPFPRIAPPFRDGIDEPAGSRPGAADEDLATAGAGTDVPPTLVNNVETVAHAAVVLAAGADAFRALGTDATPGTVLVTVSGQTRRHGVAEVPAGTSVGEVLERVGGGPRRGRRLTAVLPGVSAPPLPAVRFDTPLCYDALRGVGSGLGAGALIALDDSSDPVAVAAGVARFLSVESCGQCRPCKEDGLALAALLDRVRRSDAEELDRLAVDDHLRTVTDGARCFLAHQTQQVVGALVASDPDLAAAHARGELPPGTDELVAPIVGFDGERFELDATWRSKRPDWSRAGADSGAAPAEHIDASHARRD